MGGLSVAMVRNPATGELAIRSDSRTYPDDKINELLTSSGDAIYEVCGIDEKWFLQSVCRFLLVRVLIK